MIVIKYKPSPNTTLVHRIEDNPTPGTYGSHLLLLDEYRNADIGWFSGSRYKQMRFNEAFLDSMLHKHGSLHCVYCNKQDLKIYHFPKTFNRVDGATTDHLIPQSIAPELAMEVSNLRVSCSKCNNKKKSKIWEEKFPYE